MTNTDAANLAARLAAVECVVELLLAARLAAMPRAASRDERTRLLERVALLARRRNASDGEDASEPQPTEADVRHALGNLVQKAMVGEDALRRRKPSNP